MLASSFVSSRFSSFCQRYDLFMARVMLLRGPVCARHTYAVPARRSIQAFATAGNVTDSMQPVQTAVGAAGKSPKKLRSLTRKEAQGVSAEPITPQLDSDTKNPTQDDDKDSKEAAQKKV
ncbi:MAG: hypothetical protein HC767_06050 [Akkermansiaceae bacterium]|nr:hypothetical protein [Akkermansiaceae bacterium]